MPTLDRDLLQATLRGYAEINAIGEAERRQRLAQTSSAEHWALFEALYEAWELTGQQAGGHWEAVAQHRLANAVALRQVFELFARRKGWI